LLRWLRQQVMGDEIRTGVVEVTRRLEQQARDKANALT
jgi:hypothetical protein